MRGNKFFCIFVCIMVVWKWGVIDLRCISEWGCVNVVSVIKINYIDRKLFFWYMKYLCNFFFFWWFLYMIGIKGDVYVYVDFVIEVIYLLELLCYLKFWFWVVYYDGILIVYWNIFFF